MQKRPSSRTSTTRVDGTLRYRSANEGVLCSARCRELSRTGLTARRIARYRLPVWVASPSPSEATRRQLAFSYGVQPLGVDGEDLDWSAFGRTWIKKEKLTGRLLVVVQGPSRGNPHINHRMELIELETQ